MHFVMFSIATVILLVFVWQSECKKKCYKAKTCIHDGNDKCGVDENGTPRWFLDSCDILEYNCYYNATYTKAPESDCFKLPRLEEDTMKGRRITTPFERGHAKVINEHWCWRAKYCRSLGGDKVCAVDIRRKQRKVFRNDCAMYKYNCHFSHDFTKSVMYECKLIPSVWKQIID